MAGRRVALVAVFFVIAVGVMGVAFAVGNRNSGSAKKDPAAESASRKGATELHWEGGGVAFSSPRGWKAVPTDESARLVVGPDGGSSLLVRALPLPFPVSDETLPSIKDYAARIVTSGDGVALQGGAEDVEVGGMRGFFYRYAFQDPGSGQRGLHLHYFFFHGPAMVTAVFQALPEGEYSKLSPVFDGVLGSFRTIGPAVGASAPPG